MTHHATLPPEVWDLIINILEAPPRELKLLCLTSHTICRLTQPVLFHRIVLRLDDTLNGRLAAIESMMSEKPERQYWVKEIEIIAKRDHTGWGQQFLNEAHILKFKSITVNLLLQSPSLQIVRLSDIKMDARIRDFLLGSPNLTSLWCERVNSSNLAMGKPSTEVIRALRSREPPFSLTIDDCGLGGLWEVLDTFLLCSNLGCLQITDRHFPTARIKKLIRRKVPLDRLTTLAVLEPNHDEFPVLLELLAVCPNLLQLKLSLRTDSNIINTPHSCSTSIVPRLVRLESRVALAEIFTAKRPIETLELFSTGYAHDAALTHLATLSNITPILTELILRLEWQEPSLLNRVAELFPRLKTLSIRLSDYGHFSEDFERVWIRNSLSLMVAGLNELEVLWLLTESEVSVNDVTIGLNDIPEDCRLGVVGLRLKKWPNCPRVWTRIDGVWREGD